MIPSSSNLPLTLVATALCSAPFPVSYANETAPSLEISFRKVTDHLIGKSGKNEITPERAPSPLQYEEDLVAHSGVWGLQLLPGAPLVFKSKDVLPTSSGLIITDIRTASIEGEGELFSLALANKEHLVVTLQKGGEEILLRLISADGKARLLSKSTNKDKSDRANIALAYDLDAQKLWLYVNQREVASVEISETIAMGGSISFGDAAAKGLTVTLSSIAIFPGTPATFTKILGNQTPSLPPVGPASPWYAEGKPKLAMEALNPDVVLRPWEPIKWANNAATVWGRTYSFGGTGSFVPQVTALGKPLLAGKGIQLLIGKQGALEPVVFDENSALVSQHAGQVVLKREAKDRPVSATIRVEYDGMIWIELEAKPASRDERITLSIPMSKEFAEYYHYIGAPHRYESQNLRRNSYSGELPAKEKMVLPFKTTFWLGNTHAGLSWFAESDESWWPHDDKESIVFTRNADGSGSLDLHLVSQNLPDNAPETLRYHFGLMATPVKPMPKGWRGWSLSAQYDSMIGPRRGSHLIYWPDEWRRIFLDPEPTRARNVERISAKVKADREAGRKIIPYWSRIHVPVTDGKGVNPDVETMRKVSAVEPDRPAGSTHDMIRVSTTSEWADYLVWAYDRWNSHMGNVDGWYFDETQPIPNTRAESGGGYNTWDGTRRPTFEFLGTRDLMKRVVYLTEQWGRDPQFVIHNSSTYAMPYMSFYQVFLVGEQFNSGYFHPNPEVLPPDNDKTYFYSYVLPVDRMIAEGFWRQWGVPIAWMGQLKNQPELVDNPTAARDYLSRLLQMDAIYWPLFIHNKDIYNFHQIGRNFGISDEAVTFTPFWENKAVTSDNKEVVCGVYNGKDGWLVVVSNLSRSAQKVTLDLSGLGTYQKVNNAEKDTPLSPDEAGKLTMEVPRNDYALIRIQR